MAIFNQFKNLIEWQETRDDVIFHMWKNKEIKKDSKVIIRPGQDAIFLYNGVIEGVFKEDGEYKVSSQIIPFLTTLKSFKFGFNTPLRAEVLFVNTKEFLVKWGTKQPINLPHPSMPGGMPIRCFGTYALKVSDYGILIDRIAGIKEEFTVDDVKERLNSKFNVALTSAILKEGKDLINLQAYALEIGEKLKETLNELLNELGLEITDVSISNVNYPEEVQKMIEKNATYGMVGDVGRYRDIGMIDAATSESAAGNTMANMAQAGMGLHMGMQMMNRVVRGMDNTPQNNNNSQIFNNGVNPNYENINNENIKCNGCNNEIDKNAKFCPECGTKVEVVQAIPKFCSECGTKSDGKAKFCLNCGNKLI